jgi:hypothetical protein
MTTKLILLATAAAFTFASCSQETKTTETTTTTLPAGTDTTRVAAVDTLAYRNAADDLAGRVAADLHNSDMAFKNRLQQVYYTRGRALRNIDNRYMTDTTGRYAAVKAVNDQTSSTVKTIVPAAEYGTYTSNAGNYYAGPYTTTTTTTTTTTKPGLSARVGQGSGVKKLENKDDSHKVKYENGAKIKRSDDGSVKIKRADGTKIKIDENGHRTVKKGLF